MRLVLCRSMWGLEADPGRYPDAIRLVAEKGYDAVGFPAQWVKDPGPVTEALAETGLSLVTQVFTTGRTVDDHVAAFRGGLEMATRLGPTHVVLQGGRDGWRFEQSMEFLRAAVATAADAPVPVLHETHRTRILFSPWVTERVLEELPDLPLVADLGHWTCVVESLRIPDRIMNAVAARCRQVDARVGWEEGPQVADPRVERYAGHVGAFERWWDAIWEAQADAGASTLTMQPEFGPPPYQAVHPVTGEPLADVIEVNDWMGARLRERYGAR